MGLVLQGHEIQEGTCVVHVLYRLVNQFQKCVIEFFFLTFLI